MQDEYRLQKAAIEVELERLIQVQKAMLNDDMKQAPDTSSIIAMKKALEANTLTQELVDLLIDKVLIYPDSRIEIIWKDNGANTVTTTLQ
jgi:hypothetical protein